MSSDTIAAIATGSGRGGIAVVRVSGPDSFSIARTLSGRDVRAGRITYAQTPIDDCVILAFKGPHSYTGEDVVEFQCHGGTVTPRRMLEACFANGARLARRGEFTQRAFLNARLDYDQAKSVIELIDAKTDRAADAALEGLAGRRAKENKSLYERALRVSSTLEYALDVDESDLGEKFFSSLRSEFAALSEALKNAEKSIREKRLLQNGALVVLAGAPNSGKSSLLNALLEENRAIVSDTPGTTRDAIEAWLDIDGWPVKIVDTAGLRTTSDQIEAQGVKRAEDLISKADIVIALDCDFPGAIKVHSKCDISRASGLNVSAVTGEGIGELKSAVAKRLEEISATPSDSTDADFNDEALSVYVKALTELKNIEETITSSLDIVLAANTARIIANELGNLSGQTYSSDLLEQLFSRFCVGK